MKYLIILLLFPWFLCAQSQDSTVYEKRDTMWYKITYSQEGTKKTRTEQEWTSVDSLIRRTLENEVRNASLEYNAFKRDTEFKEQGYLLRIRQAEKAYKDLYKKKPDLDVISKASEIIGTWLLNSEEVVITKTLKLKGENITFTSENTFWTILDKRKMFFFKDGNAWKADNYRLIKLKK